MKKALIASVLSVSFITSAVAIPVTTFASPQTKMVLPSLPEQLDKNGLPSNGTGGVSEQNIISNVIKKAITNAIRYGGSYMSTLLSKLSPSAGKYLNKYSNKIADFLDSLTDWQEATVANFLLSLGIPPAESAQIAYYIVWLAGF